MGPPDLLGNSTFIMDNDDNSNQYQSNFEGRAPINSRNNNRIRNNWNRLSRFHFGNREDNDNEYDNRPRNQRTHQEFGNHEDNNIRENIQTNSTSEIENTHRTPRATFRPNLSSNNVDPPLLSSVSTIPTSENERTNPLQVLSSLSLPDPLSHSSLGGNNRSLLELENFNTSIGSTRDSLNTEASHHSFFDIEMNTSVRRIDSILLPSYQPSPPRSLVSLASLAYLNTQSVNSHEIAELSSYRDNRRDPDSSA